MIQHNRAHVFDTRLRHGIGLGIAKVGQAQDRRAGLELLRDFVQRLAPLRPQVRFHRLECSITQVEAHHALNGGTEIDLAHLAAGEANHARVFTGDAIAGRQAARIQFQDKVAAAVRVRHGRTGNVIATMLVGIDQQALGGDHACARQARLARILITVAVLVIKDLTDDITAIEGRVWHHAHGCLGGARCVDAEDIVVDIDLVNVLAFTNAGTDDEQRLQYHRRADRQVDARPAQFATGNGRLGLDAIQRGRTGDILEARRHGIDDVVVIQGTTEIVGRGNGVRHQLATRDILQRRGLGQRDARASDNRIQRDVVIEQLAR